MTRYTDFIPENTTPAGVKRIGIYNSQGFRIGHISPGHLLKEKGKKRYCFGALSDIHIGDSTATADFTKALQYLSQETDFICISGDLVHADNDSQRAEYKALTEAHSRVPVYACAGNHDAYHPNIAAQIFDYTGNPLYYSFSYDKDVFIFVGVVQSNTGSLFTAAELQWLYETLEANRNKRCFLFQHVRPDDGCGNALGIYTYDIWGGTEQTVFESLLRHYTNVIFFHGHSHLKFDLQQFSPAANIDQRFGCWSVHVPSITVPRGTHSAVNPSRVELYAESEGYVIDVYENGIHLRGRDFVKDTFLPMASYWLDTPCHPIAPETYLDSTGTIQRSAG